MLAEQKKNKLLELVTVGAVTAANFKKMTPVRSASFVRADRNAPGHEVTVRYIAGIGV